MDVHVYKPSFLINIVLGHFQYSLLHLCLAIMTRRPAVTKEGRPYFGVRRPANVNDGSVQYP